jgi:cytochrome c
MKSMLIVLAAAGGLLVSATASAATGEEMFKGKKCDTCHAPDVKKMGPALKDIAAKNKDNKGAADAVLAKMKEGKGHPKTAGTDDELKQAVGFALTGK